VSQCSGRRSFVRQQKVLPISARLPAVDPTIAAAWITGGVGALGIAGTVVTAWIGSRNTKLATERTIAAGNATTAATLAAAHDAWLREKQSAAYEETLAGLLYRQAKRSHDLRGYRWDEATEAQLKEVLDRSQPPGWFQTQGRLNAYASDAVREAFEETVRADSMVRRHYEHWQVLHEGAKVAAESGLMDVAARDSDEAVKARKDIPPALGEAQERDQALIKLIRDELRGKPEAAMLSRTTGTRARQAPQVLAPLLIVSLRCKGLTFSVQGETLDEQGRAIS
jgi:hypothetical protein